MLIATDMEDTHGRWLSCLLFHETLKRLETNITNTRASKLVWYLLLGQLNFPHTEHLL